MSWQIWALVPILYGLFCLWYFNWRGPVTKGEIDKFLDNFSDLDANKHTEPAVIRKFLEDDDGNEFVMLNLIQLHGGKVPHPLTGEKQKPRELIANYFKSFSMASLKRLRAVSASRTNAVMAARAFGGSGMMGSSGSRLFRNCWWPLSCM